MALERLLNGQYANVHYILGPADGYRSEGAPAEVMKPLVDARPVEAGAPNRVGVVVAPGSSGSHRSSIPLGLPQLADDLGLATEHRSLSMRVGIE
jgi:hypothetical protein